MEWNWIFADDLSFTAKALRVFHYQSEANPVYKRYLAALNCHTSQIHSVEQIPFLPIHLFKKEAVVSGNWQPQTIFESSGTTGTSNSRHLVKDLGLYEASFFKAFQQFYGSPQDYCILGLLPSYLERGSSSLVYMVQKLVEQSGHHSGGFYLYDFEGLEQTLRRLEAEGQRTILIGVTYALLDFAAAHPLPLQHTLIMETGGMKGRKKELLRAEVHEILQAAFHLKGIHSEYGMTELLSQAYATQEGMFHTPSWMQALLREEDDPMAIWQAVEQPTTGALNIIDLANIHSCSFIATEDVARLHPDGGFEVLGRLDHSDIRGCSLLAI
ncbi:hypothetical protein SAMN05444008_10260 [Cnuella takakiae]|uniref:Acyl-protein synthetase, LuxE n=1 Tax=Cnuella takakiae TaxID=1302690 RepID=A0A1M4UV86_9BACT|nr:acyl transferase [Cnuella takakiae]OLY92771.1 acyl transferase [Cnuella takakiae]SHE60646.1 hypothetical protein SAMN05444008_10260 [Cnuella takakiae]